MTRLALTREHVARMRELWAKRDAWEEAGSVPGEFPVEELSELMNLIVAFTPELFDCAGAITGELEMGEAGALLAEGATNLIGRHELEEHDGEVCVFERGNLLAFFAHRIGATDQESVEVMLTRILDYQAFHGEMHVDEHDHRH